MEEVKGGGAYGGAGPRKTLMAGGPDLPGAIWHRRHIMLSVNAVDDEARGWPVDDEPPRPFVGLDPALHGSLSPSEMRAPGESPVILELHHVGSLRHLRAGGTAHSGFSPELRIDRGAECYKARVVGPAGLLDPGGQPFVGRWLSLSNWHSATVETDLRAQRMASRRPLSFGWTYLNDRFTRDRKEVMWPGGRHPSAKEAATWNPMDATLTHIVNGNSWRLEVEPHSDYEVTVCMGDKQFPGKPNRILVNGERMLTKSSTQTPVQGSIDVHVGSVGYHAGVIEITDERYRETNPYRSNNKSRASRICWVRVRQKKRSAGVGTNSGEEKAEDGGAAGGAAGGAEGGAAGGAAGTELLDATINFGPANEFSRTGQKGRPPGTEMRASIGELRDFLTREVLLDVVQSRAIQGLEPLKPDSPESCRELLAAFRKDVFRRAGYEPKNQGKRLKQQVNDEAKRLITEYVVSLRQRQTQLQKATQGPGVVPPMLALRKSISKEGRELMKAGLG
eukprot:g5795.t1